MRKLRTIMSMLLVFLLIVSANPGCDAKDESSIKTGIIGAVDEEMRMYDQLGRPEIDSISKAQLRSFFCLALSSYSFSSARCMHFWKVSVSPANLS